MAVTFLAVVVIAGYAGYRAGTIRLVASLDAQQLPRERASAVYRRLERLCVRANTREPPLLVTDLGAPNALSIGGPRKGVVVLDRRLFNLLTIDELEVILAHELAHMERYHTFVNTLALTAVRMLALLVSWSCFRRYSCWRDSTTRLAGSLAGLASDAWGLRPAFVGL